jgi:NADH-quinone oxidoreductase subunit G
MAKFKLNGKDVEAPEGSLVIDAAKNAGVEIPHYCYHPALGNPGNCRLCIVEVEGAPKPMVSCRTPVKEGMVVRSDSEGAKRAQASSLELHLANHPLDCPVCDQSGECGLQDYYMKFGRYESQVQEDKRHKEKRKKIGEHVMLDQERCVLCTRCTRFTEQVTKTNELGIFGRGHSEKVDLAPGKTLDNAYSGNVIDICPVGALTDRDFRFKVRVWYLDKTDSICPNCSRGCSISVHTNTKRPWHDEGKRVSRIKPRHNPDVNGYWICDEGRFGYKNLDEGRLGRVMRLKPSRAELTWETAVAELAPLLRAPGLGVVASGMLSNEDWAAFKKLFVDTLKIKTIYFSPEPEQVGEQDDLLRRREKVANLKAAEALGLKSCTLEEIRAARALYCIERDPAKLGCKGEVFVFQSPFKLGTAADTAFWRLPATAYVEEEGRFTNFEGKIQKYNKALESIGQAKPDHEIFELLRGAL